MSRTDSLKDRIKSHHQTFYSVARAMRDALKAEKKKKNARETEQVIHCEPVSSSAPLSKIYLSSGPKRINLIFEKFNEDSLRQKAVSDALITVSKFAASKNVILRIISRNNLPNPNVYVNFLAGKKLDLPEKYSFYTDYSDRVSSPIYRLEVSNSDIFFTIDRPNRIKEWLNEQKQF